MSNNFRKTTVLKKIWIFNYSFTPKDSTENKNEGVTCVRRPRTTFFLNFYTFVCKKVQRKIADKYKENLKQASGEI